MTYKDNTPTYNVNRKVVNFKDFDPKSEKDELNKVKKSYKKTDLDVHRKERKDKFNRATRKLDDLDKSEVEDKLEVIEENSTFEEFKIEAEEILNSCEKYSMEDGPNSMDTVISLSDAIDAIANYLVNQDSFNSR